MMLVDAEVRTSPLAQQGVFAKQLIKKGTIVSFFMYDVKIMSEEEYQEEQAKGNVQIIKTACRYVGKYFLFGDTIGCEEYFNHSFTPNVLYHCGICFALRDIQPDEELSVNYHYVLAYNDVCRFNDTVSGQLVDGLKPTEVLVKTAKELLALYDGTTLID